jgi:membrane protease YdiL (CAAX protease family)
MPSTMSRLPGVKPGTGPLVRPARGLNWFGVVAILVIFAVLPSIVDLVRSASIVFEFPDQAAATNVFIGSTTGLVVAVVAVTVLRWWPVVVRERLRLRGWVWVVPAIIWLAAIATIDFAQLRRAGWGIALTVLLVTLLIAAGEELVFRGILLTFLRVRYTEVVAAVVTTLVFGAFHLTGGPIYALSATVFGYVYYCVRRVSGGILLPIVLHALGDFTVLTAYSGPRPWTERSTSLIMFAVALGLVILMVVLHRRAEPAATSSSAADASLPATG